MNYSSLFLEKHKQVIFISKQQDNDVCYLQNKLRVQQWNVGLSFIIRKLVSFLEFILS